MTKERAVKERSTKERPTKKRKKSHKNSSLQGAFSLPVALLIGGLVLIAASFLPLGNWVAQSQWTPDDSAKFDQVSFEYKRSTYQSPDRLGLNQTEFDAQRDKMRQQLEFLRQKLDRAKSQPQRWSRYLLGIGSLLTAIGFYANASGRN